MKKILFAILLIFLIVIATYVVTHLPVRARINEKFCLWEGQSAIISNEGLKIKLVNSIYSPCPEGVVCFWSGIGAVINMSYSGESTQFMVQGNHEAFGYSISAFDISQVRSCFIVNRKG